MGTNSVVPTATMNEIASGRGMERRKRVRHRLASDAVYMWQGQTDTYLHGDGVTRDVSLSGAFIFSLICPPVGIKIQLDILLFPLHNPSRTLRLQTDATVIRIQHGNVLGEEGFAVVLDGVNLAEGSNQLGVDRR